MRRREAGSIIGGLTERRFVPTGDLERVKMQDSGQGIELVKAGNDAAIFDVRQAANVEDEVGATPVDGDLIAGLLNIPISEAESFARLS